MNRKKLIRSQFRSSVFTRDKFSCRVCGAHGDGVILDAHHITSRDDMPYGGYVAENGISLCETCHIKAEAIYKYVTLAIPCDDYPGFLPGELYILIGSSQWKAIEACGRLEDEQNIS